MHMQLLPRQSRGFRVRISQGRRRAGPYLLFRTWYALLSRDLATKMARTRRRKRAPTPMPTYIMVDVLWAEATGGGANRGISTGIA